MPSSESQILNNRYRVESLIGKGGMGSVYRGTHVAIGRRVAIKFLHTEYAENEKIVIRFFREAQAAAAIEHKNIIEVLDVGVSENNEPYIVMEYLEGESLAEMLKRTGPVDASTACGILEPVLLALNAAYKKGIVHRDLKPDNIFLVRDVELNSISVKLIDFGVSKFIHIKEERVLTQAGMLLGTPTYMAPEQVVGASEIDHRADIYSVGVIFFEMLTGKLPFEGTNARELLVNILTMEPLLGIDVVEGFPAEVQAVLDRALSRETDARFENAQEMLDALKQLSVFPGRHAQLSRYASGVVNPSCAVGDLGDVVETNRNVSPQQVLSQISKTPIAYEQPQITTLGGVEGRSRRKYRMLGVGAAILLLVGVSMIFSTPWRRSPSTETPPASAGLKSESVLPESAVSNPAIPLPQKADTASKKTVEISLTGLPSNAAVHIGEEQMSSHTFQVPFAPYPISIRVEADGFEHSEIAVVPTEDRTINIELSPSAPLNSHETVATKKHAPATEQAPPSTLPKTSKKKFRKGKRGTEIAEEFK